MKTKIIAISNNKGGVSKTTTAETLGVIFASMGFRTLLVDLDAQRNLTTNHLANPGEGILESFQNPERTPRIYNIRENLDIIPASERLSGIETALANERGRERFLSDILGKISEGYRFVLLDCPPSLGLLTINALSAADYVLIPTLAETRSAEGLSTIIRLISQVRERINPRVQILGIFLSRWNRRRVNSAVEEYLRKNYGDLVLDSKIRENVAISESPTVRETVLDYSPSSIGAEDFRKLSEEILRRLEK